MREERETVLVTLQTEIKANGERDLFQEKILGQLQQTEDGFFLYYKEKGEMPTELIFTGLHEVKVRRESGDLRFLKNKKTKASFQTPIGCLPFTVNTQKIELKKQTNVLLLTLQYTLWQENSLVSENKLKINIQKRKKPV